MMPQGQREREQLARVFVRLIRQMRASEAGGFCSRRTANAHIASYWGSAREYQVDHVVGRLLQRRTRRAA